MAVLGLIGAAGCSTRTEELQDWVRDDAHRDKLIVFVHGFNSNKDKAWGEFPALLKDDDEFKDFNIHRFGYPTKLCRQVSDIRKQGDLMASFLTSIFKSTQPKYRQVVLVGHSMGGLVILHALLKLERDLWQLLKDQDLKVLTFGTPYFGVENTDLLELFCENKQANDMRVLNDTLGELAREWTQRFNQKPAPGGRDTPQVPLYAFRGTEDGFITKTSACSYPQIPCESVAGDHFSIVKPTTRSHPAYQKLKELATQPRVPPTAEGKIGIWVARLTGDDASHADQRDIARTLEFFIRQEEAQLQGAVEVRELQADIAGNTLKEKEAEAKRLGQDQHAAIVVWGEVTRSAGVEKLHPRVTLIKPLMLPMKTAILAPVSHASQRPELSTPPETVSMPPQAIKEPLHLARFVLAVTLMEQQAWVEATGQLDKFIAMGLSTVVSAADIYFIAGLAHTSQFLASGKPEPLNKAQVMYSKALTGYQEDKNWANYAAVQANLGVSYLLLAQNGVKPPQNLQQSVDAFKEAARWYEQQQDRARYAMVQSSLGFIYPVLAGHGVEPLQNLQHSVDALKEAARWYEQQQDWARYAMVQTNLGVTYGVLAQHGVEPPQNLQHSVDAFKEAVRWYEQQQNWARFATDQDHLGMNYQLLAEHGVEPPQNLQHSVDGFKEAARWYEQQKKWVDYARVQSNLGVIYRMLAEKGVDPTQNFRLSNQALKEASTHR